jgi:hypothetical protein
VGVALRCRHPRMAEHLLNDTDVHALLDQQRRGGMPGVMDPGISHFGLPENHLPGPPVLGTFDRPALPCGEDQIMIPPGISRPQPLDCLPLAMLLEQIEDRGRALERELAFALTLPKDDAPVSPLRALVSVSNATRGARTLITNVALPGAVRFTSRTVPVLLTALLAGSPVPLGWSVWGALLLSAALAAARDNDIGAAWGYLRRAERAADRIHADRNDLWTSFGPTNVAIHGISVSVELGDVPETIRRAEQVSTAALPADLLERRAQVLTDLGRAYVQRRDDAAATAVFRQAEDLAPEEVHYSVPVREALREMLKREHRYATPELRPLARRTGIIS